MEGEKIILVCNLPSCTGEELNKCCSAGAQTGCCFGGDEGKFCRLNCAAHPPDNHEGYVCVKIEHSFALLAIFGAGIYDLVSGDSSLFLSKGNKFNKSLQRI